MRGRALSAPNLRTPGFDRPHRTGGIMASNERSRQQSAEGPGSGTSQQGAGVQRAQPDVGTRGQGEWQSGQSSQAMQRGGQGGRQSPATRGGYEPAWYGGGGGGPFALMRRISDEMDRMFESFGMGAPLSRDPMQGGGATGGMRTLWSPSIEMCERDGKLLIQADLPGMRKEDIDIQVEQDALILRGERRHESQRDEGGFFHTERSYGSFHRVIPLPEGIDAEQARASFRDGVLEIELPAPQQRQRGRRLTIDDRSGSPAAQGGASTDEGKTGAQR
jgi:HSP20 family protein